MFLDRSQMLVTPAVATRNKLKLAIYSSSVIVINYIDNDDRW